MAAGAYQKCEKTQGNRTWAKEWATPVERSRGHSTAALLENGPQLHPSAQRHCGRPDGSRDLATLYRVQESTADVGRIHSKTGASTGQKRLLVKLAGIEREVGGVDVEGSRFSVCERDHVRRVHRAASRVVCGLPKACDSAAHLSYPDTVGDKAITFAPL
jgi:hypothetical protein